MEFIKVESLEGEACKERAEEVATEKIGAVISINASKKGERDYWFIETRNLQNAVERYCAINLEKLLQFREISEEMFFFSSSYSEGVVETSTFTNFASKVEEDQKVIQYDGFSDVYHIF